MFLYVIKNIKKSKNSLRIIVSSEDSKILEICKKNNIEFIKRPKHLSEDNIEKQHLFSFTNNFLKYLKKRKIYTVDLTSKINKDYKSQELYFLCSKEKKYIKKFQSY